MARTIEIRDIKGYLGYVHIPSLLATRSMVGKSEGCSAAGPGEARSGAARS